MRERNTVNEYLKRLKNGEKCLDEFYNAVLGCIKYVAYKYLIDKSYENDVVMNTFCKVLDNIQNFDEQRNGTAWICKIAQNEAYRINERERKQKFVSLEELTEEVACTSEDSASSEFIVDLERAIQNLDDVDRQIVEMRFIKDMKFEDIAKRLNMYVGSVYKRYKKSIKKISEEIF